MKYYAQSSKSPTDPPLGVSDVVSFALGPAEPTQLHLSLTSTPGEMRVMWVSGVQGPSEVWFGARSGQLTSHALGSAHTYNQSALCHKPQVCACVCAVSPCAVCAVCAVCRVPCVPCAVCL